MCYFSCQAKKITISRCFTLISKPWWHPRWRPLMVTSQAPSNTATHKIRLSTEGKIVSEYSNIPKPLGGGGSISSPHCTTLVGLCTRAPPRVNIKVFISRTIVRWWDTTRPAPGLTWSTGALFSALFRLGALKWNYITLWIRNRVDAKSVFFFFPGDVTRSSPVPYYCIQDGNLVPRFSLLLLTLL